MGVRTETNEFYDIDRGKRWAIFYLKTFLSPLLAIFDKTGVLLEYILYEALVRNNLKPMIDALKDAISWKSWQGIAHDQQILFKKTISKGFRKGREHITEFYILFECKKWKILIDINKFREKVLSRFTDVLTHEGKRIIKILVTSAPVSSGVRELYAELGITIITVRDRDCLYDISQK